MSFDTYANLQTEVLSGLWKPTGDTALIAAVPGFISLVEGQVNLRMRVRQMIGRSTATISDEYSDVPTDFIGPRSFRFTDTTPITTLEWVSPQQMSELKTTFSQTSAKPEFYTVVGPEFEFCPVPSGSNTAALTYWKRVPALSGAVNWLLTYYPHVYMHGCLAYGWRFLRDDEQSDREWSIFLQSIEEANEAEKKEAIGGLLHLGQPLPAGT